MSGRPHRAGIGIVYLATGTVFLAVAGFEALLMRIQLAVPRGPSSPLSAAASPKEELTWRIAAGGRLFDDRFGECRGHLCMARSLLVG